MKWTDRGIILSQRVSSEHSSIVTVFTREHGKHNGLIRLGSKSQNPQSSQQPGTIAEVTWNARLSEHLGNWKLDPLESLWIKIFKKPLSLAALSSACALLDKSLPERHPYSELYEYFEDFLHTLIRCGDHWQKDYIFFELKLLSVLGFGLDLRACAVTQSTDDLAYVSPKTGRAVCKSVGDPYKDRLFLLPNFLVNPNASCGPEELQKAYILTEYFLRQHLFDGKDLPLIRRRLVQSTVPMPDDFPFF
ncbi:MAG: DNA repair protein RecO [Alphaproteobacteria bacterium]|nr:DNA repair protein RecO [Alphaproteobacteria bacterium]